jgi:MFS family permease
VTSAPPSTAPTQVVGTYLAISGLFTLAASVIWGVNTLFLLDAGLDIFEVFVVNAAYTAGMVLFEIPTGVVADTSGRRRSFLLSVAVLALGTLLYVSIAAAGGSLVAFLLASVVLGLGFSFFSGAVEAWLVDALGASGYDGPLDSVFARGSIVSGAAMVLGSVGGGLLGSVDLAWPFIVRAALLAVVFAVGVAKMHDIGFTPRTTSFADLPTEMRQVLDDSWRFGWRTRSIRLLMIVSALQGVFMMWGWYAWPPYLLELLGRDATWVAGVVSALVALAMIAGNGLVEYIARFCGRRTTLLLWSGAVVGAAAVGLGIAGSFWSAVVLLLLAMGATGVGTPVQQAYLHAVVPSAERATVASASSLVGSVGGIGGQLGLGYLSQARSLAAGYVAGGLVLLLASLPLLALRRMHERADVIVGRRAGKAGPCAGQGLPPVSTVDATPRQPELVP